MSSKLDDVHRPARPRSNTSTFASFNWRRGRPDSASTPVPSPSAASSLPLEDLIEALTPPAVPSLSHARALAHALSAKNPNPKLAILSPILASLCSTNSPLSLQAAGYDVLAAYWENSGSSVLTTGDRLSCLALFLNPVVSWSQEVWEFRFKALVAIIQSGAETIGMEGDLLRVLRSWIEGAFEALTRRDSPAPSEELSERQRSVEVLTAFLTSLVGKAEFVSRLSEQDTADVLQLWAGLLDRALLVPLDYTTLASPPASQAHDPNSSKTTSPNRISLAHKRHQSSTSLSQVFSPKHPADIVVDAYLSYLGTRLKALAPSHLKTILPLLFRALAFYASPLPRISLNPSSPHQNSIEKRITSVLNSLVAGPYSSNCTFLLKHFLFPANDASPASIQTSLGALKTFRASIRELLINRLARAYITRTTSMDYTPAGVPTHIDLERGLMERAWSKDDAASWDLLRFRNVLRRAVKAWVEKDKNEQPGVIDASREVVLSEVAAILKDVVQALDERGESEDVDDEEVNAVGDVLCELIAYVHQLRTREGGPIVLSLSRTDETSPFLSVVSGLLSQDLMTTPLYPVLPTIILSMAEHIADSDTAHLLMTMSERQSLSPTSPAWLEHWQSVLVMHGLYTSARTLTRQIAMDVLQSVWEFVKDISVYRRPLAELIYDIWKRQTSKEMEDVPVTVIWNILGDEIVLRSVEARGNLETDGRQLADDMLDYLKAIAHEKQEEDDDAASVQTTDHPSVVSPVTAMASPVMSRMQTDNQREKESTIPTVMSLLSSFTSGNASRSQSQPRQSVEPPPVVESPPSMPPELPPMPKTVGAVVALISVFGQLAFTPLKLSDDCIELAARVFHLLVDLISDAECVRARLTVLQFLMRLRVDRDHKLYFASTDYDKDGCVLSLTMLINRAPNASMSAESSGEHEYRSARPRVPQERDGRRPSRGRGGQPQKIESRSRSRTTRLVPTPISFRRSKARDPLWSLPEILPFSLADIDTPSEGIMSYDPSGSRQGIVLSFGTYLEKLVGIFTVEREWEILSYVLCHLPTQLANKHLFCGPKTKAMLGQMLAAISTGIINGNLAANIEGWPDNFIARDAHGLAYNTLSVLISYKRCFPEVQQQHRLVEAFLLGLNGQPSTIKCCLNALSLSAFELQPSMTRSLSRILEKLSQIMSNPAMAVHIIDFLAIVGSLPSLHANFTEGDYKMVFAVALQYLQHHNRPDESVTMSWALSQHVRIMSYYIVYIWFLAVDLPDRPRHIKFISRQLLLANEGKEEVDEPAEVCFDWLARYTYGSADPRPASSMLSELVMNPALQQRSSEPAISEKTWIAGNAVITVRSLMRRGWVEVMSRRASGLTKFICRVENVPMVSVGDDDPDMVALAASVTLERGVQSSASSIAQTLSSPRENGSLMHDLQQTLTQDGDEPPPKPDPITGYVWSGSAPSQRRKTVAIDPSYFALQLSSYPENVPNRMKLVNDSKRLSNFFRSLDRMPVIDTHKVGIMYVAPGQTHESEILRNTHGSPAYSRFLEGLARLIKLRDQTDVYVGGLDPDEDGEYAYAWWNDIGQILYHTATMMPSSGDERSMNKKRHIGNDFVRIVWNDSGMPYKFDTLATQFQFVNIVIEPHSRGAIAAFSNNLHEHEYFKVIVQRAPGMTEFSPIGDFKLISAENLPLLVRQLSLLTDWFVSVFQHTKNDTVRVEMPTNWLARLQAIKRFRAQVSDAPQPPPAEAGVMGQVHRDFTAAY
ncbi:uncharacterized protein FIBRA_04193 [Fibroporia radiculosa]|uniref:Rap-GAP domain-containing protein n=1 Tax=Fibroporia radiculosa TaxID=599839 RepID=J4IA14_9APHY|nr:uncharacterized protein FIBRA_04193 [Fibroporia radiculosa]CCM02116.1 predicted protein [Fibroporia radiculosa]